MSRVEYIRMKEKEYHDTCYDNYKLFSKGTWLYKPVKSIMEELNRFRERDNFNVLDLGCGVGRNSIPIALTLKERYGKVVCVDMLNSALEKLDKYCKEYGVSQYIDIVKSEIEEFSILVDKFDMIVAISSLEHLRTKSILVSKIREMKNGTKVNGVNCIIMNSNIIEVDKSTKEKLDPLFEINISTKELLTILDDIYKDWITEKRIISHQLFNIQRDGRDVLLETDCLTYFVRKV